MITSHWPTQILHTNITNAALVERLFEHVLLDPDTQSNDAASATRDKIASLITEGDSLFLEVEQTIRTYVDTYFEQVYNLSDVRYRLEMFHLLHQQGKCVSYHNHRGSTLTGILYVNVPSGGLTLVDPRPNANRGMMGVVVGTGAFDPVELHPKNGDIVIFPSYVYHIGIPNTTPMPRVVLTFDVMAP